MADGELRLLVRAPLGMRTASLALDSRSLPVALTPLFSSIKGSRGLGMRAGSSWHLATAKSGRVSPWDACHLAVQQGLGVTGGVEFAEPDLEQQWPWSTPARQTLGMAGECGPAEPQDSDTYAVGSHPLWFRDTHHSQLGDAGHTVGAPGAVNRIRIAHLDTGFDANHSTKPINLRLDLQRNFVDADRPNDATDQPTALINPMFGHGAGTIGLLAGDKFNEDGHILGGAPLCEVVPIRVANWVVLFRNSAIAQALDYVHGLWNQPANRIHVVTMSMGGIASAAWADAINALYERGIFVVTAAGNNFGGLPTRHTVYPARFNRVVSACGVMEDGRPYADLPRARMAGCYGPASKARTSMSAFTPNVPWAKFGCPGIVDLDGGGTSAATPQIAAAAALWMQKHHKALESYPEGWMRVEATRKALFESARAVGSESRRLGRGILQADAALSVKPLGAARLAKEPEDSASFGLLKVLFGMGVAGDRPSLQRMLELEALQLSQRSQEAEVIIDGLDSDDPSVVRSGDARRLFEVLADHPAASVTLKRALYGALGKGGQVVGPPPAKGPSKRPPASQPPAPPPTPSAPASSGTPVPAASSAAVPSALNPVVPLPPHRALRVYAFDPLVATRLETVDINEAVINVPWEEGLKEGPVGEYFEVVDVDPPSDCAYAPVDLNHPSVLARQGLTPTEGNPQFHQQMAYAVAMKTVERFEMALGRRAQWAQRLGTVNGEFGSRFVRRLRIYPHALRERNAFYSPSRMALLFGYFNATASDVGGNLPGGLIFTCLSHDIIAHETTHALLDGLHPRYKEPSSLDMLAFHEAFADIVALFQHFTLPEALRSEIAKRRGDLSLAELLGGLAGQFGEGIGNRGALRSFIAKRNEESGRWEPIKPSQTDYANSTEAHDRGAVLVAAVFDAFLQIYRRKTEDLFRLASQGTGILPEGRIPHDLVERLAGEAAKIAGRVLNICIRALDYCPPVDLTFGEYLRALITADRDLVPYDPHGYRIAFISAFRARGIFPAGVTNLSVDGLAWQKPDVQIDALAGVLKNVPFVWEYDADRYAAYEASQRNAEALYKALVRGPTDAYTFAQLGLVKLDRRKVILLDGVKGYMSPIEMHSIRPVRRVGPDDQILDDIIIEMTQRWKPHDASGMSFRGGCTIVCDRRTGLIRYVVRKRVGSKRSVGEQMGFRLAMAEGSALRNYFAEDGGSSEPFAMVHRH